MQAATYTAFGPADQVLTLKDIPVPPPQAGEVTVDIAFSGVNPSDVKARAGGRPGVTAPPFDMIVPHSDGAGIISAVGADVPSNRIGQRVWIWNGQWRRPFGTAAQKITLPQGQAVPLPDTVDMQTGATLGIPGLTAAHTVFSGGDVQGQTVLVQGGAGTVGYLAVQLARRGGARVIATAGGPGLDRARTAGAELAIDYNDPDLAARIMEATAGHGVDRIVEVEFGRNAQTDADVIAENGVICAYGSAQDMQPTLPFYPLMFKAVTLEMALVYLLTPAQRQAAIDRLTAALAQGGLHSPVAEIFDLEACAAAHDRVAAGQRAGAVLVRLDP